MHNALIILTLISIAGCHESGTAGKKRTVFEDRFDRSSLGNEWLDTGGNYTIENGQLRAAGARNHPLWLKKKLPKNAEVSFTARSMSPEVDIKVELFGDGVSRAEGLSYRATSYVVILGGWKNTRSIIARMNEHGKDRQERRNPKGVPGKVYRFVISRLDDRIEWILDGSPFLQMIDSNPLRGEGHEYFAFNNWMSEVFFDDLVIRAL